MNMDVYDFKSSIVSSSSSWRYHIETYTGHAEIRDPNHVFIQPIEKYNYTNVYDANGRNPYETDDYKSISDSIEISTKHIIVIINRLIFNLLLNDHRSSRLHQA